MADPACRLGEYKNASDKSADATRSKRREHTVELRKFKREGEHVKRRNVEAEGDGPEDYLTSAVVHYNGRAQTPADEYLDNLLHMIHSEMDPSRALPYITEVRRLLSQPVDPPIQHVIDAQLVPVMVHYITTSQDGSILLEAAWVITNISSGTSEQTLSVIECGAIPALVGLLSSPFSEARDQAIWGLANIAGDGPLARNKVLEYGTLEAFIALLSNMESLVVLRTIVWAISNLCRYHNPPPPMDKLYIALPVIKSLLLNSQDIEIKRDACWAVSYVTTYQSERIQAVLSLGLLPVLVKLLEEESPKILTPAVRAIGNIVSTDSEEIVQIVLDHNVLPFFRQLLEHRDDTVRREICWVVANILASSTAHRRLVIESSIIQRMALLPRESASHKVQVEIGHAIANLITRPNATVDERQFVLSLDTLPIMFDLLAAHPTVVDDRLRIALLHALRVVLALGMQYLDIFVQLGGQMVLERLGTFANSQVVELSDAIIQEFIENDNAVDLNGQFAPNVVGNMFAFPQAQPQHDNSFNFS